MAEVNKISSFKSFTEVKTQETAMKLREENNAKRQETVGKIGEILDEMGVTSLTELEEDTKQALISKMFGNVSEDEAEDIEDEINKLGEPKKLEEGNAFVYAAGKAKAEGKDEFEFNGKTYKVTIKDTGVKESIEEGNAFGDAVRKAKEAGESEFEFEGETYKVEEHLDEAISRSAFDRMDGLHNTKAMDALLKSAEIIFKDLYDEMFEFDEIVDFITMTLKKSKLAKMFETVVTEGKHGMAKKLLKGIVDGDSTEAEGIKMSKELADHYLSWVETSPYGKRNENLPLYMLVDASFNWGIERGLPKELKKELDSLKDSVKKNESIISEAAVKQFDADFNDMVKNIKAGYGWIDPEYVADTWENSSDSIDFELVKGEIYKRLIAAKLLAYADDEDEESAGQYVKSLKELGIKESVEVNENSSEVEKYLANIASDYQFDKTSNDYTGFLNVEPNEQGKAAIEFINNVNKYKSLMKKFGLSLSPGYDGDEAVFVKESVVNEEDITSDDQFKEYAMTVLKDAFKDEFDEAKAEEVIKGILGKCDGDYGACVGMLTGSLGESFTNEATIELDATDPKDKNLGKLLKKHNVTLEVINKKGPSGYPEVKLTGDVKDLKVVLADDEYGWDDEDLAEYIEESTVTEAIDVKYWEDYHEKSTKITSASKVTRAVQDEVEDWNDNNENGEDNKVTNGGEKKVMNLAHDFFKAAGWISLDVIHAMIAQES
jgi:hypothetical protein